MNANGFLMAFGLAMFLAAAAPAQAAPAAPVPSASTLLFAEKVTWHGFLKYWKGFAHRADRIVFIVALIGGLALMIIVVGGKWR